MISQLITGFLAGLSTGLYCLGACLPIFVPLIMAEKKNLQSSFLVIWQFSLGRLTGYLLFGGFIGYLGKVINLAIVNKLVGWVTILTGLMLVFYSVGLLRWNTKACKIFFKKIKIPMLLGFLTGVNVCPPFIASLTYVFGLKDVIRSVLYFLSFFVGTSMYLIPAGFLGFFSQDSWLQKVAKYSGIFIGFYFVWRGYYLLK
jgi:sulfite exporter TauE/SafE